MTKEMDPNLSPETIKELRGDDVRQYRQRNKVRVAVSSVVPAPVSVQGCILPELFQPILFIIIYVTDKS